MDINRIGLKLNKINKARNKKMARYIERQNLMKNQEKILKNRVKIQKLFESEEDIRKCHCIFSEVRI